MKLVIIGIQGAGKSTQGNLLSRQLGIPYLSTGHILRDMTKEKTTLGRYIKETINAGVLVPDEKMIPIVENYLNRPEYQNGYILDGFPRTIQQAKRFKNNIDKAIYLKVPDREALWRLAHRNDISREDETLKAIRKRIELFHRITTSVIEYYRKRDKLIEIDGTLSINRVNRAILTLLGKTIGKNGIVNKRARRKILLAIVGLPGAGKSVAARFFKEKKIPVVRLGAITDEVLKKRGLINNLSNNQLIREELRKKYGMDAYLKLNLPKIRELFRQSRIVVVDGLRSYEEYITAKKIFKNVFLLAIIADKKIRYQRLKHRKERSSLRGEDRDLTEVVNINMGSTIALADHTIINNGSFADFVGRLEEVYRQVYYGMI